MIFSVPQGQSVEFSHLRLFFQVIIMYSYGVVVTPIFLGNWRNPSKERGAQNKRPSEKKTHVAPFRTFGIEKRQDNKNAENGQN